MPTWRAPRARPAGIPATEGAGFESTAVSPQHPPCAQVAPPAPGHCPPIDGAVLTTGRSGASEARGTPPSRRRFNGRQPTGPQGTRPSTNPTPTPPLDRGRHHPPQGGGSEGRGSEAGGSRQRRTYRASQWRAERWRGSETKTFCADVRPSNHFFHMYALRI